MKISCMCTFKNCLLLSNLSVFEKMLQLMFLENKIILRSRIDFQIMPPPPRRQLIHINFYEILHTSRVSLYEPTFSLGECTILLYNTGTGLCKTRMIPPFQNQPLRAELLQLLAIYDSGESSFQLQDELQGRKIL